MTSLRTDIFQQQAAAGQRRALPIAELDAAWRIIIDGDEAQSNNPAAPKQEMTTKHKFHIKHAITGQYLSIAAIKFDLPTFVDESIHEKGIDEGDGGEGQPSSPVGGGGGSEGEKVLGRTGISSPEVKRFLFKIGQEREEYREGSGANKEGEDNTDSTDNNYNNDNKDTEEEKDGGMPSGSSISFEPERKELKTFMQPKPETFELVLVAEPGEHTLFGLHCDAADAAKVLPPFLFRFSSLSIQFVFQELFPNPIFTFTGRVLRRRQDVLHSTHCFGSLAALAARSSQFFRSGSGLQWRPHQA